MRSAWAGFRRQVARPRRQGFQPNEGRGVKARYAPHQPLRALGVCSSCMARAGCGRQAARPDSQGFFVGSAGCGRQVATRLGNALYSILHCFRWASPKLFFCQKGIGFHVDAIMPL